MENGNFFFSFGLKIVLELIFLLNGILASLICMEEGRKILAHSSSKWLEHLFMAVVFKGMLNNSLEILQKECERGSTDSESFDLDFASGVHSFGKASGVLWIIS